MSSNSRFPRAALAAWTAWLTLPLASNTFAQEPETEEFPRIDPDNPGGERLGQDGADDGFTGYPADPGAADDPYFDTTVESRPYVPNYTAAYVAGGLTVGATQLRGRLLDQPSFAPAFGAHFGLGTVAALADFQLSWVTALHSGVQIETAPVDITHHSLAASVGVHPGFFWLIGGTRLDYTIADFALVAGPSIEWMTYDGEYLQANYAVPGYHVGARIATYLDSPQDGGAAWLGFEYRYNNISGSDNDPFFERQRLKEHTFTLRIQWRVNGLVTDSDLLAR
jgi:hypothetical protein